MQKGEDDTSFGLYMAIRVESVHLVLFHYKLDVLYQRCKRVVQ